MAIQCYELAAVDSFQTVMVVYILVQNLSILMKIVPKRSTHCYICCKVIPLTIWTESIFLPYFNFESITCSKPPELKLYCASGKVSIGTSVSILILNAYTQIYSAWYKAEVYLLAILTSMWARCVEICYSIEVWSCLPQHLAPMMSCLSSCYIGCAFDNAWGSYVVVWEKDYHIAQICHHTFGTQSQRK